MYERFARGHPIAIQLNGGSMSKFKFILPAVIAVAGMLVSSVPSSGKAAFTAKTKKACTFCHVDAKAKPKELTPAGKYYQEKNTLEGYQAK
jgi:hypothetical protein